MENAKIENFECGILSNFQTFFTNALICYVIVILSLFKIAFSQLTEKNICFRFLEFFSGNRELIYLQFQLLRNLDDYFSYLRKYFSFHNLNFILYVPTSFRQINLDFRNLVNFLNFLTFHFKLVGTFQIR